MSDPNQPYGAVPPPPQGPPSGPPSGPPQGPPSGPPFGGPPQGPPPGGGFGAPTPYPGGPGGPGNAGGKGKGLWIGLGIAGVIALVAIIVVAILLLTGGDDDDKDSDKGKDKESSEGTDVSGDAPDEVVETILSSAEDGDCEGALDHLAESAQDSGICESEEVEFLASGAVEYEIGDPEIDGDEAVVPVEFTSPEGSSDYTFELVVEDDEWKLASFGEGDSTGSTDDETDHTDSTDDPTDDDSSSGSSPSGSSSADSVPNDPTAVVTAFVDSFFAGDCATAEDLVTAEYLAKEGDCEPLASSGLSAADYTVGDPVVDDAAGTAEVPVTVEVAGSKEEGTFSLVKENGNWRINSAE